MFLKSINKITKEEENYGIKKFETYKIFGEKVYKIKENVIKNIQKLKSKNNVLVAYGAPAKATTALNFFGISNQISYIVEDNKLKHDKYIPGVNIPIVSKKKINGKKYPIIVLAWNFFKEIKKNNNNLKNDFISIKDLESEKFN